MLGKVFIMAGQKSEYNTEEFNNHNSDKSESGCHIMEENQTSSEDKNIEIIYSSRNQCEFQTCLEKIVINHMNGS
jgi:hypothetical protein